MAQLLERFKQRRLIRPELDTLDLARVVASVLLSDIAQRFVFGAEYDTRATYFPNALEILLKGIEPSVSRTSGRTKPR